MTTNYTIEENWDTGANICWYDCPTDQFELWKEHAESDDAWIADEFTLDDFKQYIDGLFAYEIETMEQPLYHRGKHNPEWYAKAKLMEIGIAVSATSGMAFRNEWYVFTDRDQAVDWIREHFDHQCFVDQFELVDEEYYKAGDCRPTADFSRMELANPNAKPADLGAMVAAEKRF